MKEKIQHLAEQQNAIILAHNYQPPEIQKAAHMCGDSLELSIRAAETTADVIVFCGVHFMAESASILSPEKKVLLPAPDAGCPMADMVTPEALVKRKKELGDIPVITYVNSTAAVKAVSDVCCTSANVTRVVESVKGDEVLMTPDRNLARYAALFTNKTVHLWKGFCPYHDTLSTGDVLAAREEHPKAVFMAHPECPPEVIQMADAVKSTSGMLRYAGEVDSDEFIVGTETGLMYPLSKAYPEKRFFAASEKMFCTDMKKISLENLRDSLENLSGEVRVPEEIRKDAYKAVKRMVDLN